MQYIGGHTKAVDILEAAYSLLLFRCEKKVYGFPMARNTARGVRFLLRFSIYLFLTQSEQVYLFLAFDQKNSRKLKEEVEKRVLGDKKVKKAKKAKKLRRFLNK